jgi:predicted DNA-binding transcriptional regulator AlpA
VSATLKSLKVLVMAADDVPEWQRAELLRVIHSTSEQDVRFIRKAEAAELLGISRRQLDRWCARFPELGRARRRSGWRTVVFRREAVEALAQRLDRAPAAVSRFGVAPAALPAV